MNVMNCTDCGKPYGPAGKASEESCDCLREELRSLLRQDKKEPEPETESTKILDSLDEIC